MLKLRNLYNDPFIFMREVIHKVNDLIDGQTGDLTLANSATTTTVDDARVNAKSFIGLSPKDQNAAAENWSVVAADGSFTVTHSSATTTRTFKYVVIG